MSDGYWKVTDIVRKVSDTVKNASNVDRKVSGGVRKVSDAVGLFSTILVAFLILLSTKMMSSIFLKKMQKSLFLRLKFFFANWNKKICVMFLILHLHSS